MTFGNLEKNKIEKEVFSKEQGLSDLLVFLGKIKAEFDWSDKDKMLNQLENISEKEFESILKRINGIIANVSKKERSFLSEDSSSAIATGELAIFSSSDIVFPEIDDRRNISSSFFVKLQNTIKNEKESETLNKRVAISIFNSIIYIHPFVDANGRTARLSYFLLSPDIKKEDKKNELNIKKIIENRPASIEDYHYQLNLATFFGMLEKRGIPLCPIMGGDYSKYRIRTLDGGFDERHLKFLAANDVMTDEERKKFNVGSEEGEIIYDINDFDEELKERYLNKLNDVRKEFTKDLLDFSLDKEGQIKQEWLQRYLDKAVSE